MKINLIFLLVFVLVSCKNEPSKPQDENQVQAVPTLEKGQQLFQENNCAACHQPNQKVVGPSLEQIATIYIKQKASLVSFLKQEAEPIVDSSQYETMKINLELTKVMTDEELKSLEIYILSCSK